MLVTDIITHIVPFLEKNNYLTYSLIAKEWRDSLSLKKYRKYTYLKNITKTESQVSYYKDILLKYRTRAFGHCVENRNLKGVQILHADYFCDYYGFLDASAKLGDMKVFKWLRKNGHPWSEDTLSSAALYGHLDIIKWAYERGCPADESLVLLAATRGHLDIIKWAHSQNLPINGDLCSIAARYNNFDIIVWARENNLPWDSRTVAYSLMNNNMKIAKWAVENNCEVEETTCSYAVYGGLDTLKWARQNGIPWDYETTNVASEIGDLETLRWARENGCEVLEFSIMTASEKGHVHILEYLSTFMEITPIVYKFAVAGGKPDVMRWARERMIPYDIDELISLGMRYDTLSSLDVLLE
jgi:hypothetical protein